MGKMAELHAELMDEQPGDDGAAEVAYVYSCLCGLKDYISPALYAQVEQQLGFKPEPALHVIAPAYNDGPLPF